MNGIEEICSYAAALYENHSEMVKEFGRHSYEMMFETYRKNHEDFFKELKVLLESDQADEVIEKLSDAVVSYRKEAMDKVSGRSAVMRATMDQNMFTVTFLLPAVKEVKSDRADDMAEAITKKWAEVFTDSHIQAATYESIQNGFKRKLCYVTTAVCTALDMGQNCEELRLIKQFRDTYMLTDEERAKQVTKYYDVAPTIVKRISSCENSAEIFVSLWTDYISKCVAAIKNNENAECEFVYTEMMNHLIREYFWTAPADKLPA